MRANGTGHQPHKAPTVNDVARLAGVSRQTVSNVIHSPEKATPATRERVERAIRELHYRPNLAARRLRTNQSRTLAVRLDPYAGGISGAILDRFLHALTAGAAAIDHRVLVYAADSLDDEMTQLRRLAASQEIDGAILTGTFFGDPRPTLLREADIPFVSFGRSWDSEADFPWVDVDGAAGTRQATEHALAHSALPPAFLGWPADSATGDDRRAGWASVLSTHGIESSQLDFSCLDSSTDAHSVIREALAAGLASRAGAIVCASDLLAVGAYLAIADEQSSGLRIYGFDNTPTADALGISSVEQHPELVAEQILRFVHPSASEQPSHIVMTPELVIR